jgi:hypothetical protein
MVSQLRVLGDPRPTAPLELLQMVRYVVRAAIAGVFGADGVPENADGYRPHISLAYAEHRTADRRRAGRTQPGRARPAMPLSRF